MGNMAHTAATHSPDPVVVERLRVPFFRLLAEQGRSDADLELIRRTLDLSQVIYAGQVDFDGGPFQCHGIGTASVAAQLGLPIEYVAFALVHNAYKNADFGGGRRDTAENRDLIRSYVGDTVESYVHERCTTRISMTAGAPPKGTHSERMMKVEFADLVEKWENGRIWSSSPDRNDRQLVAARADELTELASEVCGPEFGSYVERVLGHTDDLPDAARTGEEYSFVVRPMSTIERRTMEQEPATEMVRRLAGRLPAGIWRRYRRLRKRIRA